LLQHIKHLKELEDSTLKVTTKEAMEKNIHEIDEEMVVLRKRLEEAKNSKLNIQKQRSNFAKQHVYATYDLRDALSTRVNELQEEYNDVADQIVSIDQHIKTAVATFDRFKQINAVNDAFYVWYTGPFATINGFKMGNLVNKPVESTELNAAFGQAALALSIITSRCGIEFKQYHIAPMGSFPKILKADDRRTSYPLFIDSGTFSFFPKRNFNLALAGFMQCIYELGEYISAFDPTLSIPYKIEVSESRIADKSFVYGGDEEIWTHALKLMLANIKWIIAWYCKHGNY
jgi:beclin